MYRVVFYAGLGDPLYWNANEKTFVPGSAAHSVYANMKNADMDASEAIRNNKAIADNIYVKRSKS